MGDRGHSLLVASLFSEAQEVKSSDKSEEGDSSKSKGMKRLSRRERGNEWTGNS